MKKYQIPYLEVRLLDGDVDCLTASNEANVDVFEFQDGWLNGGNSNG